MTNNIVNRGEKVNGKNVVITEQTKNLIICIKPCGISSEYTEGKPNVVSELERLTGCKTVKTLHRLDVGVGGVMVYAKNKDAAAKMSELIAQGKMIKQYSAIVHGVPENKSGALENILFKDSKSNKVYVIDKERKGAKKARLTYETLCVGQTPKGEASELLITLDTGRSHQIRAQFSHIGHPLFGDGKYGAKDNNKRICLMSKCISFVSPFDNAEYRFECKEDVWELLGFGTQEI